MIILKAFHLGCTLQRYKKFIIHYLNAVCFFASLMRYDISVMFAMGDL